MKNAHLRFGGLTYPDAGPEAVEVALCAAAKIAVQASAPMTSHVFGGTDRCAASTAVIKHEPESEPDEHGARRPVEGSGYARSTQPARNRARGKRKQREPKDAFGRVNDCKQHTERCHRDAAGYKLRQECNVEDAHFRVEKVG